jgi:hypothetical protein
MNFWAYSRNRFNGFRSDLKRSTGIDDDVLVLETVALVPPRVASDVETMVVALMLIVSAPAPVPKRAKPTRARVT